MRGENGPGGSFFCPPEGEFIMNNKFTVRQLCVSAVFAALYAGITILTAPFSYGLVQFRFSEALVMLCVYEPLLGVGITLGCFLANLFSTVTALDLVVGTLATALACLLTGKIRNPWLAALPNILLNALLVGGMLAFVLFPENVAAGFAVAACQVGFGEAVVMYALGVPLFFFEQRTKLVRRLMQPGVAL